MAIKGARNKLQSGCGPATLQPSTTAEMLIWSSALRKVQYKVWFLPGTFIHTLFNLAVLIGLLRMDGGPQLVRAVKAQALALVALGVLPCYR